MIQLQNEKNCSLTAQDRYNIIAAAIDMAEEDDGFINSFIFERALYVCAARELYPDIANDINSSLLEEISPLIVWNNLLEDGTIENMIDNFQEDLNMLADEGTVWFEEVTAAKHSMRAMVDAIQVLTDGMASGMTKQLDAFKNDADINSVVEIADKWGLNNDGKSLL